MSGTTQCIRCGRIGSTYATDFTSWQNHRQRAGGLPQLPDAQREDR